MTVIFMTSLLAAIIIFDVFIIIKKGKSQSISAYIIRGSKKYPLLVLLGGIVLGHLFWSMNPLDWKLPADVKEMCKNIEKGQ